MHSYEYEMPAVTVDVLVIKNPSLYSNVGRLSHRILLVQRKYPPFEAMWAFPGGYIEKYEDPGDACIREVKEETGIQLPHRPELFYAVGNEGRDPRGWTISLAHKIYVESEIAANPSDDAIGCRWFDMRELPDMAFDHRDIIEVYWNTRR